MGNKFFLGEEKTFVRYQVFWSQLSLSLLSLLSKLSKLALLSLKLNLPTTCTCLHYIFQPHARVRRVHKSSGAGVAKSGRSRVHGVFGGKILKKRRYPLKSSLQAYVDLNFSGSRRSHDSFSQRLTPRKSQLQDHVDFNTSGDRKL